MLFYENQWKITDQNCSGDGQTILFKTNCIIDRNLIDQNLTAKNWYISSRVIQKYMIILQVLFSSKYSAKSYRTQIWITRAPLIYQFLLWWEERITQNFHVRNLICCMQWSFSAHIWFLTHNLGRKIVSL